MTKQTKPQVLRPDGEAALELLRDGTLDAAVAAGEVVLVGNDPGQRPPAGAGFEPATEADLKEHAERQAAVERARQPQDMGTSLETWDKWPADRWDDDGRVMTYRGEGNWEARFDDEDINLYRLLADGTFKVATENQTLGLSDNR